MKDRKKNTPTTTHKATADRDRFNRQTRELADKILRAQYDKGHMHLVERMERHGLPRRDLAFALALAVGDNRQNRQWWHEEIRRRIDRLEQVAGQLESASLSVDAVTKDPFCRVGFWRLLLHGKKPAVGLEQASFHKLTIRNMQTLARKARKQARVLGSLLRVAVPYDKRLPLLTLLFLIRYRTAQDFDAELITLLDDAFDVTGRTRPWSLAPTNLRKIRSRYLPDPSPRCDNSQP